MYENDMYEKNTPPYLQQNSMVRASFTLGIISVLLCSIFYVALPCGALAILCALLSRTGRTRMTPRCFFAITCGLCGITASILLTSVSMYRVFTDPKQRAALEYYLKAYTGDPSMTLEDLFPFLSDDKNQDPILPDQEPAIPENNTDPNSYFLKDGVYPGTDFFGEPPYSFKNGEETFV